MPCSLHNTQYNVTSIITMECVIYWSFLTPKKSSRSRLKLNWIGESEKNSQSTTEFFYMVQGSDPVFPINTKHLFDTNVKRIKSNIPHQQISLVAFAAMSPYVETKNICNDFQTPLVMWTSVTPLIQIRIFCVEK